MILMIFHATPTLVNSLKKILHYKTSHIEDDFASITMRLIPKLFDSKRLRLTIWTTKSFSTVIYMDFFSHSFHLSVFVTSSLIFCLCKCLNHVEHFFICSSIFVTRKPFLISSPESYLLRHPHSSIDAFILSLLSSSYNDPFQKTNIPIYIVALV